MTDNKDLYQQGVDLVQRVGNEVLSSAGSMQGTIIAAAAFGGLCLFVYKVIAYYRLSNADLISKEHALAVVVALFLLLALPIVGVIFVGMYGITNHFAAWQIGLTSPMLIESALMLAYDNTKRGEYHKQFIPEQADA